MADDGAELAKLHKELFPTEEAYRAWQRSTGPLAPPPAGTTERQQYDDFKQLDGDSRKETPMAEENKRGVWTPHPASTAMTDLTPEQQAGVDKALAGASINESRALPPPETATGRATPAPPAPQKSVPELGATLQQAGVTMDKG